MREGDREDADSQPLVERPQPLSEYTNKEEIEGEGPEPFAKRSLAIVSKSLGVKGLLWVGLAVSIVVIQLVIVFTIGPQNLVNGTFKQWIAEHTSSMPVVSNAEGDIWLQEYNEPGRLVKESGRASDIRDAFQDYHKTRDCNFSSLDFHAPFAPLCDSRQSLLTAMTDGGRIGIDAPYSPRGCDMRWYNNDEVCDILSKFSMVFVVGDSMMRGLSTAMHIILRKDLKNGGRTTWIPDPDGYDCSCDKGFMTSQCAFHQAHATDLVIENDPDSLYCPIESTAEVKLNIQLAAPLNESIDTITHDLPKGRPTKPYAFVFGHGAWNGFDEDLTKLWYRQVHDQVQDHLPWLKAKDAFFPQLFVTPVAAGPNKPLAYLASQGNAAVTRFEKNIRAWISDELDDRVEHLGLYNMTIQNTSPDGTHAGMKANIIKSMMVLNWLAKLDTSSYYKSPA